MEAFVYSWKNKVTGKEYIGYHKGDIHDGYVSSSKCKDFWIDYADGQLEREILFEGTKDECVEVESNLLRQKDFNFLYNRNRNGKIIFTDDVLEKMSQKHTGRKQTEEHIRNRSAALKGRQGGFKNKKHSVETIEKMRSVIKTTEHKLKIAAALTGRPSPTKGRKHNKKQCPHCERMISLNTFQRWHGDNCKQRSG